MLTADFAIPAEVAWAPLWPVGLCGAPWPPPSAATLGGYRSLSHTHVTHLPSGLGTRIPYISHTPFTHIRVSSDYIRYAHTSTHPPHTINISDLSLSSSLSSLSAVATGDVTVLSLPGPTS